VRLINWRTGQCDSTYNPYYAVARISEIKVEKSSTSITLNFPSNCCSEFNPVVKFTKGNLFVEPYKQGTGEQCDCDCFFSLTLAITGLPSKPYDIFLDGKIVERSDDPYPLVQPTQESFNNTIINRTNKYGFKEGIWMTFSPNGKPTEIIFYPEKVDHPQGEPIYTKGFYPNGSLSYYERSDTLEAWFDDGEIKVRSIKFMKGDTTFDYRMEKYDNRKLKSESLEKTFSYIFTSEFDPDYRAEGTKFSKVMKKSYYESGKREYVFEKDTSLTWYESNKIKRKEYEQGAIAFNETGTITERVFYWQEKGPKSHGDLQHALYIEFYNNGATSKVHYVRDEVIEDGVAVGVHYNWTWNIDKTPTQSLPTWKEPFPWKKFPELKIP